MILVSACLLGQKTKYNGGSNPYGLLQIYGECGRFLPVCPECLGGLAVPRPPAEIIAGDGGLVLKGEACVKNRQGEDVTAAFLAGAVKVREMAQANKVKYAVLKENSPSCGVHSIYDGSFAKQKKKGRGVCAAMLAAAGITVYSEKDLSPDLIERMLNEDMAGDI